MFVLASISVYVNRMFLSLCFINNGLSHHEVSKQHYSCSYFVVMMGIGQCKVKCTLVQALKLCTGRTAHRRSRGVALLFHDQRH